MSSIALVSRCRSPGLKLRLLLTGFSWHKSKASWRQQVKRLAGPVSFGLLLGWLLLSTITQHRMLGLREQLQDAYEYQRAPVLISYAYFEKDEIQARGVHPCTAAMHKHGSSMQGPLSAAHPPHAAWSLVTFCTAHIVMHISSST